MRNTSFLPPFLVGILLRSTQATVTSMRSITRPLAISSLVFFNNWGSSQLLGELCSPPAVWASDLVTLPSGLRETIAKGAATLPGMGQPDVYYPDSWEGSWTVIQTYTDIVEKQPTSRYVNLLQQVRHKKTDINPAAVLQYNLNLLKRDDKVILDRSFTETNRYRALLQLIAGAGGDTTAQWVPSNPNTLTVHLDLSTLPTPTSSMMIEEKVTKRAVEQDLPTDAFGFSEYARMTESLTKGSQYSMGVPKIYGIRRLQRLRVEASAPVEASTSQPPVDEIKGVERMYIYNGESLDLKDDPLAVIKSKFVMTRITESK